MDLKYSHVALQDLDRIWEEVFSASQSYEVSEKYINELIDTIASKKLFPTSGSPLYYEDLFTGFYSVRFKSYIAFYHIDANHINVDRVLFSRSDYMNILFRGHL